MPSFSAQLSILGLGLSVLAAPAWAEETNDPRDAVDESDALPIVKVPAVTEFIEADYPPEAKAQGMEATVGLAVEIDAEGVVQNVSVIRPAGYGFDASAIDALQRTRFTPAENAEGPIGVIIEFDYNFVLNQTEPEPSDLPVNLDGVLRRMGDRSPVQGATISIMVQGKPFSTQTDEEGRFALRGLPKGVAYIEATAPGYLQSENDVRVDPESITSIKLWIKPIASADEDMVVVAERPEPDITRRTITVKEIKRIPGTFGDPVRVIQNLPGTARAPFGTGLVVVRGSNPEDTAFYVDGIRVPLIYHLGGLVSIINEDLVESVDYLPGGYGVEYGRSTGGVININTSSNYPENFRAEVSVDLLDSSAVVQGRAGKEDRWGLTAAGRRSYIDAFLPFFTGDSGFTVKPYWWDYQVKIDDLAKDNGRFSTLFMGFGDKLYFGSPDNVAQGTDQDQQGDADVHYGAHRLIVQYNQRFGTDLTARFTPSIGYDTIGFAVGEEFKFSQWFWLGEFRGDLLWQADDWLTIRPGFDILGGPYEVTIELPYSPESTVNTDPLAEREDFATTFEGTAWSVTPFIEAWIKPIDGSDTLELIPGLRFNTFILPDYTITSIDPRISARVSPTEGTVLKGGTGLYHQPPQGPDLGFNADDIQVDYEYAWSSEVGIEQQFNEFIEADVTLFYKELNELIVQNDDVQTTADPFFVNGGEGRVRGLELMLRHNPVGQFFGWISYTLSKAERYDVPVDSRGNSRPSEADSWRPFEYDQTHILVALAGLDLPRDWGVSGRFRYVTGNPFTPYAGAVYDIDQDQYYPFPEGEPLNERLPPFIALDLRADKRFTFKHWWLEAYVDLLNVVRGENPESREYNYDYSETAYIRGLPFLPSIGVRAEVEF